MNYMDALQAWIVICKYFRFAEAANNIFINPKSKANVPPLVGNAIETVDKHLDARLYGENQTDIITVESECKDDAWYKHLDALLNEIGDISDEN